MKNTEVQTVNSERKAYASPKLKNYGHVRYLTQAANSGSNEGSKGKNPNMTMSDRRLKGNIIRVGVHPLGVGLYLFDYIPEYRDTWGHAKQFGVMADEVEQVLPEAVSVHRDGYKVVDYAMLGISHQVH